MPFWILAARPDRFRLLDSVRERDEEVWRTGGRPLRAGDRVAIWKYKGHEANRGVVAFGEVLSDPADVRASDEDSPYWIAGSEPLADTAPRVRVRYTLRPDPPLWLEQAPEDSVLRRLSVVEAQGGTAFHVTDTQWAELMDLAGGWPTNDATAVPVSTDARVRVFGEIPGVSAGSVFGSRAALAAAGVHRPLQAGISGSSIIVPLP